MPRAHNNLGIALKDQGDLAEAINCHHRALQLRPDYAEAHSNLGVALGEQGKLDDAFACYRRALALKPDYAEAHGNHALLTLLTGDFEHGWAEYEWRWQTKGNRFARRHESRPLWDGRALAGKTILLHAEQGLGDTIQFVRYAPLVQERGGRVVLECQPPLLPLLADCPGIDQVLAHGDPLPAFETQAPLLSLPGILGTTLDSIPARVPYLRADPERVQFWRKKLEALDGIKVGIVWQGSSKFRGDRQRSIPLRHYEALARVETVRLVSLQKGPAADQLPLAAPFPVLDLGDRLDTDGASWRYGGGHGESGPGRVLLHFRAAPGRRSGSAGVVGAAFRAGLALVAGARRQPLVSLSSPLPPGPARRLERSL